MIDDMRENIVTYIDCHYTFKQKKFWEGPFYLSITSQLCECLGEKKKYTIFFADKEYFNYLLHFMRIKKAVIKRYIINIKNRWIKY